MMWYRCYRWAGLSDVPEAVSLPQVTSIEPPFRMTDMRCHRTRLLTPAILLALGLAPGALAQAPDTAALTRIRAEGLEHSQVMETASWVLDVFGGRLTNSPAMRAAADWAEERLRSWGIAKTWRENWGPFGAGWTNEMISVRATSPQPFPIIANVEAWTPGTKGVVRGRAIWLPDLKTPADVARHRGKLRGAFILIDPEPKIDPPPLEPLAKRHSAQDLVVRSWPYPPEPVRTAAQRASGLRAYEAAMAERAVRLVEIPKLLAAE